METSDRDMAPSKSRKIFLPASAAEISKCFRYQTGPQYFSFAVSPAYSCFTGPSIAQSWGRFSCRQLLSGKSGWSAFVGSPWVNFQLSLKEIRSRGEVAASPKQGATRRSNALKILRTRGVRDILASLNSGAT